jgi:predicted dehydrogenase
MTTPPNRREFIERTSQTAALVAATSALGGVHALADEQSSPVRIGVIGCGGMTSTHVRRLLDMSKTASIAWLCDVDPRQIDKTAKIIADSRAPAPKTTARHEDVLADDAVDACVIATPHHWHAPIALAAMKAGKDVYVEKAASHVFSEGPLLVAAARQHGRIFQHGTQMRSSPVTEKAGQLLRDGIIGEIKVARAWTAEPRGVAKPVADGKAPEGVDYDRWLGPAPERPFNVQRFHKSWRIFRDYANGEIGDDGVHDLDMAAWGLGVNTLPHQITARGGMMLAKGAGEYPDNMNVTYEYPDGRLLIYECYPFTLYGIYNVDNGNVFYGTEGYMVFSRRGFFNVYLGPKSKPGPTEGKEIRGNRGYVEHMADFLASVRRRTPTRAGAEIAHRSSALCHLGNVACDVRGRLDFDAKTEKFIDCDEANEMLTKEYREPYGMPKVG